MDSIHSYWLGIALVMGGLIPASPSAATVPVYPYQDIGDGKPATQVALTLVDGVAVDGTGNIFISHRSQNRIRKVDPRGIITTIAGNGTAGYSGDGGPALAASLNFPAGLCLDAAGNLFVADRNNHRIRKIDSEGNITTVAGNGRPDWSGDDEAAVDASLNFPSDLACAENGDLYISDRSNNRIRKVDANGIITTVVGLGAPEFGGDFGLAEDALLKYPFGIDLDGKGNLYIADRGNNRIRKVDANGTITTLAGDGNHFFSGDYGPAPRASLAYPTDVAADGEGNLYIADRNNNRIRKVDPLGIITTVMGVGDYEYNGDNEVASETTLHLPFALTVTRDQRLIVVDRSHFRIREVNLKTGGVQTVAGNGEARFRGDGGPGLGANLESPTGIVVDARGNVIFSDKQNHRIRVVTPDGKINSLAGTGKEGHEGDGGSARDASLFLPGEMALDKQGNLYFLSPVGRGSLVRKIDSKGIITTIAGMGGHGHKGDHGSAYEAGFSMLKDIAVDDAGNVYVVDFTNRNIRKIDTHGVITTVGMEAIRQLDDPEVHPNGIAVDSQGNVYFSDSGSSKVRKIAPDGTITTVAGNGEFEDSGDGGPALQAGIRSPGGLTFSPDGDLYIVEETTNRIRKVDSQGLIRTVAGRGIAGFAGDGQLADQALIKAPYRLAFDAAGNIYFTDRDNNRIRKIDPNGIISSIAGNENIGWMQDGLEVRITVHNFP